MYNLVVDTCVWIDLCKRYPSVLDKIARLVDENRARLILPCIVIDEWKRHEQKMLDEKVQSIRGKVSTAREVSQYLPREDGETIKELLKPFQVEDGKVTQIARVEIDCVLRLLGHSTTIILDITDSAKLKAAQYALEKKAPFNERNSMADALILFRAVEFITSENLENSIFVSHNTNDFGSKSNKREPHEDLIQIFDTSGIQYFSNIGEAINDVEANIVDAETIFEIEQRIKQDSVREVLESLPSLQWYNAHAVGSIEAVQASANWFRESMKATNPSAILNQLNADIEAVQVSKNWLLENMQSPDPRAILNQLSADIEAVHASANWLSGTMKAADPRAILNQLNADIEAVHAATNQYLANIEAFDRRAIMDESATSIRSAQNLANHGLANSAKSPETSDVSS